MKKILLFLIVIVLVSKVSFAQIANGTYRLSGKHTESNPKYIQVKSSVNANWSTTYNTDGSYPLQQHDETFGDDQVFAFEKVEKDFYKITAITSGKCFEANNTDAGISMNTYTGVSSQLWQIIPNTDGTFWIINKSKNTVFSIQGGDGAKDSGFLLIHEVLYPAPNLRASEKFLITPFEYSKKEPGATGNGLRSTYNNGLDFQGATSMSKVDASVNFNPFNTTNIPNGIPSEGKYSVRWEGQIESPFSGKVTFYMNVDDKVKVWINSKLVLNQESYIENVEFAVNMIKGEKSDIKIEYSNTGGLGKIIWSWSYPNQVKQVVPTKYLYASLLKDGIEITSQSPNQLIIIARDSVNMTKLRWVPPSPTAWLKGVVRGYKIERFTTKKNGVVQNQPYTKKEWEVLSERKDSPKWTPYLITNANNKVFTNTFQGKKTFIGTMYEVLYGQSNTVLTYRYYMAMLTSNLSYEASKMAGMGFTDTEALDSEEYIYKVSFLDPTTAIDPNQVAVITNTGSPVLPEKPVSKFLNKVERISKPTDKCNGIDCDSLIVSLSWNTKITEKFYGSYWLEKKNNITNVFERQNTFPFITLSKVDSLFASDTIAYYSPSSTVYRIVGRSYFDEEFKSPELTVVYTPPAEFAPEIIKSRFFNNVNAYIKWKYPSSDKFLPSDLIKIKALISSFRIEVSKNPNTNFTVLMSNLPLTMDSTFLKQNTTSTQNLVIKDSTIYVRVVAVGKNGLNSYSSAVMLMPYDNTPPAKPIWISANLLAPDKKVVELKWKANTETDFFKYAIFRKNFTGDKFWIHLSKKDTNLVIYKDTLNLNVDSDKLWYGLVAIDKRGNYSVMDSIQLIRPDTRPPMSPVFLRYVYNKEDNNVRIDWKLGDVSDVKEYVLYKNIIEGCPINGWVSIKTALTRPLAKDTTFIDTQIERGKKYCYNIIVKDDANLSASTKGLIVEIPNEIIRKVITSLNASFIFDDKKTNVQWLYPNTDADLVSFELARSETNLKDFTTNSQYTPYSSWRILANTNLSTIDENVLFNAKYNYAIRALFKDGTSSAWKEFALTTPKGCKVGVFQVIRNKKFSEFNVSVDKACGAIILEPGFDSEQKAYEAAIDQEP